MYYTAIKQSGNLRTLEKCRKLHFPRVLKCRHVLSECNTRLRLLYFFNVTVAWRFTTIPRYKSHKENSGESLISQFLVGPLLGKYGFSSYVLSTEMALTDNREPSLFEKGLSPNARFYCHLLLL